MSNLPDLLSSLYVAEISYHSLWLCVQMAFLFAFTLKLPRFSHVSLVFSASLYKKSIRKFSGIHCSIGGLIITLQHFLFIHYFFIFIFLQNFGIFLFLNVLLTFFFFFRHFLCSNAPLVFGITFSHRTQISKILYRLHFDISDFLESWTFRLTRDPAFCLHTIHV